MKYLNVFLIILVYNFSFAQNQQLYENDWYLSNLIVNGSSVIFPNNYEASNIKLSFYQEENTTQSFMKTTLCNEMWGLTTFENNHTNFSFSNYVATLMFCDFIENENYQYMYLTFFTENEPNNDFTYNISDFENIRTLTINSINNKQAIYSSQMLSTNQYRKLDFNISPNPVSDYINIKLDNQKVENVLVNIYNSFGKLCKTANIISNQESINVEELSSGIYLINFTTKGEIITRKFMKI
jgi:hypothetical protein